MKWREESRPKIRRHIWAWISTRGGRNLALRPCEVSAVRSGRRQIATTEPIQPTTKNLNGAFFFCDDLIAESLRKNRSTIALRTTFLPRRVSRSSIMTKNHQRSLWSPMKNMRSSAERRRYTEELPRNPFLQINSLETLSGFNIAVTVGIPNFMLKTFNSSNKAAESWVHENVTRYLSTGGTVVRIEYVAVGDEPFHQSYGEQFCPFVIEAAFNIQTALTKAKLRNDVKVVVPCSFDSFLSETGLPSKGHFRPDLNKTMIELLTFLTKHHSPFFATISPFSNFRQKKNVSLDFALFKQTAHPHNSHNDGRRTYKNSFDLSFDTLVTALSTVGFPDMDIVVGQIGWPTDGAPNATASAAGTFIKGLMDHLRSKSGTPLRPRRLPLETYIFSLLDEDQRSIEAGSYERHWGVFTFDGQAKYHVDIGQGSRNLEDAQDVQYLPTKWCVVNNNKYLSNATAAAQEACSVADCTALSLGGSCFNVSWPVNVSYAFNSYYQHQDQRADSCNFGGLGLITTVDPSLGDCRFSVELRTSDSNILHGPYLLYWRSLMVGAISACLLNFM